MDCSYDELMYRHISDYQELFCRVRLDLEDNSDGGSALPTDERLERLHGDEGDYKECKLAIRDAQLMVLYFNYGRYLMISASRAGGDLADGIRDQMLLVVDRGKLHTRRLLPCVGRARMVASCQRQH